MKNILSKAKGLAKSVAHIAKEYAPEAALVVGVVGVVAGVVMACVETHDGIDEIIDSAEEKKEVIAETIDSDLEYPKSQQRKDMMLVYTQMGKRLFKLYLPALIVETCSVTLILAGFKILKRRNATLVAAYTTLGAAYESYRARVREKLGEEAEFNLCHGITEEYVETVETDAKGKEKKVKVLQKTASDVCSNPYARIWDEATSSLWRNDPVINLATLQATEKYCNDIFDIQGYFLLNDVYDSLGLERDDIGCVAGWVKGKGDNHISFGLTENKAKSFMQCKAGRNGVLMNFNCCGYIIDDIRDIVLCKRAALEG